MICGNPTNPLSDKQLKVTYRVCPKCDLISKEKEYHLSDKTEKERYDLHHDTSTNQGYLNILNNLINLYVRPLKSVKTVLDYGSGPYPTLKKLLSEEGFEVNDFDPFYNNNIEYQNYKYDLIISTEVFEHFSNPIKEIKHLLSLMNDRGYLLIMTNFRTMPADEFTSWWYRRDETHVSFFNKNTFDYISKEFDLKEIDCNNKNIILFQKR